MKHLFSMACLLVALCGPVLSARDALASPIKVTPSASSVVAGQPFGVTVSGVLDPADGIAAFTFLLSFHSSISFVSDSLTLGSILAGWMPGTNAGAGFFNLSIADYPTDLTTPDSLGLYADLFTVQLATGAGTPTTTQSIIVAPDPNDNGVPSAYQFETTAGTVTVTAAAPPVSVPAPGALAVLPALLALAATRRRA